MNEADAVKFLVEQNSGCEREIKSTIRFMLRALAENPKTYLGKAYKYVENLDGLVKSLSSKGVNCSSDLIFNMNNVAAILPLTSPEDIRKISYFVELEE